MTIKELLAWVVAAIAWHEDNWEQRGNCTSFEFKHKALKSTRPSNANGVDYELAEMLLTGYWNDTQEWLHLYP